MAKPEDWQGATTLRVIEEGMRRWPNRIAIETDGETVTYAELSGRVASMRAILSKLGISQGDHVATLMGPGPTWCSVLFATMSLGAVVVPLNLTWSPTEFAQAINLTDARYLVADSHFRGNNLQGFIFDALPSLYDSTGDILDLDETPTLHKIAMLPSERNVDDFQHPIAVLETNSSIVAPATITPEDIALLLLTSGSTSFPKPVMISHRALTYSWSTWARDLEVTEESVVLNYAPNYHIGGVSVMGSSLWRGARQLMVRWFDPEESMRLIECERVTHLWGFDTHFAMMRDSVGYGQYDLSSTTKTIAASNIGPEAVKAFLGMGFTHHGSVYASTEYTGRQSYFPPSDTADTDRMMRSNGRGTAGELRIVDPERHAVLPPYQSGEICVRGPAMFSGYYKLPDESAKCVDDDGFFHSGDRGYMDEDGYLHFQGRYKEMIKSGGENVSMPEVEQFLLSRVNGIRNVAVCGVPDAKWGEAVTAAVVLNHGVDLSEADIKSACQGVLAPYKIPKTIVFLNDDEWLITATGKTDRQGLRAATLAKLALTD